MSITPENLPKHELIGLDAEVVESTDPSLEGVEGEVMDETENMLRIGEINIEKEICTFLFIIPSGEKVRVDGCLINKKPEDRAGMKLPERWEYAD